MSEVYSLLEDEEKTLNELRQQNRLDRIKSGESDVVMTRTREYQFIHAASIRVGVVVFPGTLDDVDAARAVRLAGARPIPLWHNDASLSNSDAIILAGGFSYGDYLRTGAIARFAPIMEKIIDAAKGGMPILGICNGFQILTEAHLLPGALARNDHQKFICKEQMLEVNNENTCWTNDFEFNEKIKIPLKNGEGRYIADKRTLQELNEKNQIVFRYYGDNPNGSVGNIAGVCNEKGNVLGLMPHPEHAVEPGFGVDDGSVSGFRNGTDGIRFIRSMIADMLTQAGVK
ncbi:MAG: phosphoribosylformylglycinamidine synthase subunit PurQ [Candidatus Ancillula sp.]|jgi:phosphoribosylformylglycinamidine synthase|nr:phosphoribosylformylglycinamidine synthase subunit PurQ [Candidatus Ancillula sp.]